MQASPMDLYADILRTDLVAFIHRAFRELYPQQPFEINGHIEVIAAKLDEVRRGRCKRLIVCLPPRHLKSFIVSIAFPAWLLGLQPATQIMCVSYGQDLAEKFARQCRALVQSPFYGALFQTRLSEERNTTAEFETKDGGCRIATSVGGAVTGRGGNVIIIDDFMKAEDALSDARRKSSLSWYDSSLRNRLNRQADDVIIIVTQRLHADDIVAHVQREERWDVLSMPAIAETRETYRFATPYGNGVFRREAGDVLHPAILPLSELQRLKRSVGEYHFSAQYQQDPQPPSGLIVRAKWLKRYDDRTKPDRFDRVLQSWDTANKATELSDFSVCTTWGMKDSSMYLLDVFRRRLEFPDLKRSVVELADLWRAEVVLVEDKSSGTQLIQELRSKGFSNVEAAPSLDGDKIMRLRAQTAKIEGGFVFFPREAPWLDVYLRELLGFPNTKYDDQVDSTVFALAWSGTQYYAWTERSLRGLEEFTQTLAFQRLVGWM
jgi:predicted phage terminase large subunit-like protein